MIRSQGLATGSRVRERPHPPRRGQDCGLHPNLPHRWQSLVVLAGRSHFKLRPWRAIICSIAASRSSWDHKSNISPSLRLIGMKRQWYIDSASGAKSISLVLAGSWWAALQIHGAISYDLKKSGQICFLFIYTCPISLKIQPLTLS